MKVKFKLIENDIYFGIKTIEGRQVFFLRFPRCLFKNKCWKNYNSEYENVTFDSMEELKEFVRNNKGKLGIDAEELIKKLDNKIQIVKKNSSLEEKEKKSRLVGWWI